MKTFSLVVTAATLSCGSYAFAEVIASYDFTTPAGAPFSQNEVTAEANGDDSFEVDISDANVLAGGFTSGEGVDPIVRRSSGTLFASETSGISDGTDNNIGGAVTAGDYFGFTVTANSGFTLNLTSFEFVIARENNGTQDYAVRSSVDNFATNIVFEDQVSFVTPMLQSIDLSAPEFQGLPSIELRIYFDDRLSNTSNSSGVFIDDVVLNGIASEPFDQDGDGLPNDFEIANSALGYDPNVDDSASDFDGDSSTVEEELAAGTSVLLADTDGDGFFDGAETNSGTFISYDFGTNTGDTGSDPLVFDTDDDGLQDGFESGTGVFLNAGNTGSNPNLADSDLDGLNDGFEVVNIAVGYEPNVDDSATDFDADSSSVAQEVAAGTDVLLADTDGDGFFDGAESNSTVFVSYDFGTNTGDTGSNPLVADTDGDGLDDGVESGTNVFVDANNTGSNPNLADSDLDGLNDDFEVTNQEVGYNPNVNDSGSDFDNDDSTLAQEIAAGTDVLLADTDGDGFFDGAESNSGIFVSYDFVTNRGNTGTDPLVSDTDGDGLIDGLESGTGIFVSGNDTGTNPTTADSDGDNFNDSQELTFGGDPFVFESSLPNASFGYDAAGRDWLSAFEDDDIDGDGALGTDGFIFFGEFTGSQSVGDPFSSRAESSPLPSYLSSNEPGADFSVVTSGLAGYGSIDNPNLLDGSDEIAGFALTASGDADSVLEMIIFEVSGLEAGQIVRVGILAGIEGSADGSFDPSAVFLSGPGESLQARFDLEANPGGVNAGWMFFDITSEGSYSVLATQRFDTGGVGIGGLTFDSIVESVEAEVSDLNLVVTQNSNGQELDFTWVSRPGFTYNLLSSPTLDTAPTTWTPLVSNIPATAPSNLESISIPNDPRQFYAIEEVPEPTP